MNTGKITAKLRDAVIVRLFEDGKERQQYKNIELPDALKELEICFAPICTTATF